MKRPNILLLAAILALILAACGNTPEESQQVSFTIKGQDNFRYDPDTLTIPSGAQVSLTLENTGVLEHSWVLLPNGIDPVEADEADALGGASTGVISGSQSKAITFSAPPVGTYTFVCTIPGHAVAGKIGTLIVTP
jgi:plastocyanin